MAAPKEPESARVLDERTRLVSLHRAFEDFGGEADVGAFALRQALGSLLDAHDDSRGVFVFPDVARPRATIYDAIVDEVGELGVWLRVVPSDFKPTPKAAPPAPSPTSTVTTSVANDSSPSGHAAAGGVGGVPGDMMAQLQSMMGGGNLDEIASNPEMMAKLAEIGRGMGIDLEDPNALAHFGGADDEDFEMDPAAMMASLGLDASQLPPDALEAMKKMSAHGADMPLDLSKLPPEVLAGAQQMAMQLLQGGGLDLQKLSAMMGGAGGMPDFGPHDAANDDSHDMRAQTLGDATPATSKDEPPKR